jgi:hypothetical protein
MDADNRDGDNGTRFRLCTSVDSKAFPATNAGSVLLTEQLNLEMFVANQPQLELPGPEITKRGHSNFKKGPLAETNMIQPRLSFCGGSFSS